MEIANGNHPVSSLNEWGKFTGNRDLIHLHKAGVINQIQRNDPTISSVDVHILDGDTKLEIDWTAAGECLGKSQHVKHLRLNLDTATWPLGEMQTFCRGLACNASIHMLHLAIDWANYKVFEYLLRFFSENSRLESLCIVFCTKFELMTRAGIRGFSEGLLQAVEACPSLKCISIFGEGEGDDINDQLLEVMDKPTLAMCKKSQLNHLRIGGSVITTKVCREMEKILSSENCQLKSLRFDYLFENDFGMDMAVIANGMARNKSIRCLSFRCYIEDITTAFFRSFQYVRLPSFEKIHLECDHFSINDPGITTFGQFMPNIKSIVIDGPGFKPIVWLTVLSSMLNPSLPLQELKLIQCFREDEGLRALTSCLQLTNDSPIKTLDLSSGGMIGRGEWNLFCRELSRLPFDLNQLNIEMRYNCHVTLAALGSYLGTNQNMRVLHLKTGPIGNNHIYREAWNSFGSLLESHPSLEEIRIESAYVPGVNVSQLLANVLDVNHRIKRLRLPVLGTHQLQVLANAINNPNSRVEELYVEFFSEQTLLADGVRQSEFDPAVITKIVFKILRMNTSLRRLDIVNEDLFYCDLDWVLFSNELCNKSSIETTYKSNHVLEVLAVKYNHCTSINEASNLLPIELYTMLRLNQNRNKHQVAREKIIQHLLFDDVHLPPSLLPNVMSWAGGSCSGLKLSQIYGLLRKATYLIQKSNKRKAAELSE